MYLLFWGSLYNSLMVWSVEICLLEKPVAGLLSGAGGTGGLSSNPHHSLLSPEQPSCPRAGLSLGPHPPAGVWKRLRRPGHERPRRRLRALRLPGLCRGLRLQRLPRMLNRFRPAPVTPDSVPKTWPSCPLELVSPYLSFLSPPTPTPERKVWERSLQRTLRDPSPMLR